MATRVSPRGNTSSASSSSAPSSSRRAYRNPNLGKVCGGFNADPLASDARSAYSAKQQQQQQQSGGQWGQKPYRARRGWDSGPPLAKESENTSSWRSQKLAVDRGSSFLDTGQSSGSHQPDRMYAAPRGPAQGGQPSTHASKSQWSHASPRHQSFNAQQNRPYLEEASWGRRQPSFARQNHEVSNKFSPGKLNLPNLNVDHNQGYMPDDRTYDNHSCWNSTFNQRPEISCVSGSFQQIDRNCLLNSNLGSISCSKKPLKESDYTAESSVLEYCMEAEALRDQASHREHMYANAPSTRAIGAKSDNFQPLKIRDGSKNSNQEYKNYPQNLNYESVVYLGKASQGSVSSAEGSTFRGQGDTILHRDSVSHRVHSNPNTLTVRGAGIKSNHFQSFSIGDGDMASTPHLSTNRHREGMVRTVTSWADECCDNDLQTCEVAPKYVYNTHKTEWVDSDVPVLRGIKDRNLQNLDAGVVNTDTSRPNNRQVASGTEIQLRSANIGSKQGRQGEPNKRSVHVERKGSMKHLASIASDRVAHKAEESGQVRGCSRNDNSVGDREVLACVNEAHTLQAETEVTEDGLLPFIAGTCEDMCPLKERQQRERLRDLAVFERVNRNPSKTSKELAVKKFCRTLTGVKLPADDVRPLRVLWSTQQYLLNLLDDTEFPFNVVHDFLFDRTRAIRQELGSLSYLVRA